MGHQREKLQKILSLGLKMIQELRKDIELERSNWFNDFSDGMYIFQKDFQVYANSEKLEINDLLNKKYSIEQQTDGLQEAKRKEKEDEENKIEQIKKDWEREQTDLQNDLMEKIMNVKD